MSELSTCLWFADEAADAAEFYCSIFPNSKITGVNNAPIDTPGPKTGQVITVDFELDGRRFVGLNGGTRVEYTDSVSITVECADQAEIDHYWNGLLAGGGKEVQCGWLIDRYGLRWQIVPTAFYELWKSGDPAAGARAFEAMTAMVKLDVAALEAAARG